MHSFRFWLRLTFASLCLGAMAWAHAENRAVLIGVSEYPASSGFRPLPGARNDVRLMRDVLLRKGFAREHTRLLADGIEGASRPTRENIWVALHALEREAQAGDWVYLHFSGHGAQQPALKLPKDADPEPDGASEIFLPIDAGAWNATNASVANAIADHELVAWHKRMMTKGVKLWAVFDACHSASLMRTSSPDVAIRGVSAAQLGIPADAFAAAGAATRGGSPPTKGSALDVPNPSPSAKGGYVTFYAAQPWEKAPETLMPRSLPESDPSVRPHGVLTYLVATALETLGDVSYRQLGDYLLQRFATDALSERPTPLYSGTLLDSPVVGSATGRAAAVRQWPVRVQEGRMSLAAGLLSQLDEDSRLILVPTALADDRAALATVRVTKAEQFSANLEVVASSTGAPFVVPQQSEQLVARLVTPARSYRLRVAKPQGRFADAGALARIREAADALAAAGGAGLRVSLERSGASADVALVVDGECLGFLTPSANLEQRFACDGTQPLPAIPIPPSASEAGAELRTQLAKVAKARALLRGAQAVEAMDRQAQLRLEIGLQRQGEPRPSPWPGFQRVVLANDDLITLRFKNTSEKNVDVNVFYVDSQYGISHEFPKQGMVENRVPPGGSFDSQGAFLNKGIRISDSTVGIEHIVVLIESASDMQPRHDYSTLIQTGVQSASLRSEAAGLLSFLEDAMADSNQTRRGPRSGPGNATARVLSLEVAPSKPR